MPRPPRLIFADQCYHILNRANRRAEIFHESADYSAFISLMGRAQERVELPILAACLMPNHVHLVVKPRGSGSLSRFMQWLLGTYAQRYRDQRRTCGHLWQGRFRSCPVQSDRQMILVLRYVERNPVRACLVDRAEGWPWSSARDRVSRFADRGLLSPSPVELPEPWLDIVNEPLTSAELARIRESVGRGRPLGESDWARDTALRMGLESTFRRRGRPPGKRGLTPLE